MKLVSVISAILNLLSAYFVFEIGKREKKGEIK